MPTPPAEIARESLAIFLDLDGTLVEIASRPDGVLIPPRLPAALAAARQAQAGALALISGRTIADLDALLHPLELPAAGVHGLEIRNASGTIDRATAATLPGRLRHSLAEFAAARAGLLVEDKGLSVALHFRQAPAAEPGVRAELGRLADELGDAFCVQEGKMVLELRPAGATKGSAIRRLMDDLPFAGRRPVFIGDDVTDEDGFVAVNAMQGLSIRVGPVDSSAARYRLDDVDEVLDWLESIAGTEHPQ